LAPGADVVGPGLVYVDLVAITGEEAGGRGPAALRELDDVVVGGDHRATGEAVRAPGAEVDVVELAACGLVNEALVAAAGEEELPPVPETDLLDHDRVPVDVSVLVAVRGDAGVVLVALLVDVG